MDLLEYQAKELFSQVGIPVLPSQTINDPSELKRLQIPYPVVLKSQVPSGEGEKAGGIRFVANTIDAIAAARMIFNLPILGEYPKVLLAEARYNAKQEFFLAVLLDYQLQRPVLLGSAQGGMNVERLLAHLQKVVIEAEFSPFYARRLAIKMGLQGRLIESVSVVLEKMYRLFIEKDLDFIEINPLGVDAQGKVMALDGKITANDYASQRHPEILWLTPPDKIAASTSRSERRANIVPELHCLSNVDDKADIGIITNSLGMGLATWDLITQAKGKPACCLLIEEADQFPLAQQLEQIFERITEFLGLKVVLINILGSSQVIEAVASAIADYLQPHQGQASKPKNDDRIPRATSAIVAGQERRSKSLPNQPPSQAQLQWVIRLVGTDTEALAERLSAIPIHLTKKLDEAVTQALSLAKSQ